MNRKVGAVIGIIIVTIIGSVTYFWSTGQEVAEPAKFELSNLFLSKSEVGPGEPTTATVTVRNTGGERGSYTVELSIDGKNKTQEVTLDPGATDNVEFSVSENEEGTYEVSIGDLSGTIEVTKPKPPVADFTYSPSPAKQNETTTFDASNSQDPDGEIVSYDWAMGYDWATEKGKIVEHTYIFSGPYPVTLTVTDDDSLTDNITKEVKVVGTVYDPPEATFTYSPSSPSVGENVTFHNGSQLNFPSGYWENIVWHFGDGTTMTTSQLENVTHSYSSPGDYEVTLKVVQNDWQRDHMAKTVNVRVRWEKYENNPILAPGSEEYKSKALGSMTVVKVENTFHMYYEAWESFTPYKLWICHATSKNGKHWHDDPENPVLSWIPKITGMGTWDPFVLYENGKFKLWYGIGYARWGYATSTDGTHFSPVQGKTGAISPKGAFEDDHVAHDNSQYYMYYYGGQYYPWGLVRVESENKTAFDFQDLQQVRIIGENVPCKFTTVFKDEGKWYMYYAPSIDKGWITGKFPSFPGSHGGNPLFLGGRIGYATTDELKGENGLHWHVQNPAVLAGEDQEVVKVGENLYYMYYCPPNYFDRVGCDIRLAILRGDLDDVVARKAAEEKLENQRSRDLLIPQWPG